MSGPLALVGGAEFGAGNEEQDALLAGAAAGRPAYVVCAAIPTQPERAVAAAAAWFKRFGVGMTELRARSRADGAAAATVEAARSAGLVYIAGGDPGRTVRLLRGTQLWDAVLDAWEGGAALAGSSAGAMALCRWTLVRDRWPGRETRRPLDALGTVPECALLPHFDTFGARWIPSAQRALGADTPLIGVDERTAAVWRDGKWTVCGPGAVTVVAGATSTSHDGGASIAGIPQPGRG